MNAQVVLGVVLCFVFTINTDFVEDYCWRDYDGVIPSDAFKAGIDRDGMPIYIGQVLFEDKLIPGKIHHGTNQIHIEFDVTVHTINETVKILCTKHPEHFKWVETIDDDAYGLGKRSHLFVGGFEKKVTTHIGRAWSFNELTIGKVICWPSRCIPLTTVEQNRYYEHKKYEILTYDPNGKAEIITSEIPTEAPTEAPTETPVKQPIQAPTKSASPAWYVFLVIGTAVLIAVVVILVRRR